MATIEQRFKQIAYKKDCYRSSDSQNPQRPKSEDCLFLICEELKQEDFKEPFFKGVIFLGDGFKFLSYCGKEQSKNINKNALVIQKKLSKDNKIIYRVYLMENDSFNIRDLFSRLGAKKSIKENNYSLRASDYINGIKEQYEKNELIYIINQIKNILKDSLGFNTEIEEIYNY